MDKSFILSSERLVKIKWDSAEVAGTQQRWSRSLHPLQLPRTLYKEETWTATIEGVVVPTQIPSQSLGAGG